MTDLEKAEMSKLIEERELALARVCLNCRSGEVCNGDCNFYNQLKKNINNEFKIKRKNLKIKSHKRVEMNEKRKKVEL
jgi:radical SAM protein with 4Fe4S-binding SPASM domain